MTLDQECIYCENPAAYGVMAATDERGIHPLLIKIRDIPEAGIACQKIVKDMTWRGTTEITY